ncbi:uncharacterized protein PSFLO_01302 [Pseudozyma flocculosa]|uniref:Uncharacterized protein n=1 Tax=Pseudozyma flocculosa TaxID=84751 RepID=A0A5C3EXL9_9BASI|nr:uncharacterized protein PSFLO_01302 [Pseudozyma flocculosa]
MSMPQRDGVVCPCRAESKTAEAHPSARVSDRRRGQTLRTSRTMQGVSTSGAFPQASATTGQGRAGQGRAVRFKARGGGLAGEVRAKRGRAVCAWVRAAFKGDAGAAAANIIKGEHRCTGSGRAGWRGRSKPFFEARQRQRGQRDLSPPPPPRPGQTAPRRLQERLQPSQPRSLARSSSTTVGTTTAPATLAARLWHTAPLETAPSPSALFRPPRRPTLPQSCD